MNNSIHYEGEKLNEIPHGQGTLVTNFSIFTGTWEKGLRIKTGKFDCFDFTLKVKFKQGKIYKLLEITHPPSRKIIKLPQINYIKDGDFFKEIISNTFCFLFIIDGLFLFDGLFLPYNQLKNNRFENASIFYIRVKSYQIKELRFKSFRLISKALNFITHGPAKLCLENNFYVKGFFCGCFFLGPCKISQGILEVHFEGSQLIYPENFTVKSNELNIKFKGCYKNDHFYFEKEKNLNEFFSIISKFVYEAFEIYDEFVSEFLYQPFYNFSISYSVLDKKYWLDFEEKFFFYFKDIQKSKDFGKGYKFEITSNEDQVVFRKVQRIQYDNGCFYYGEVRNGLKHGLGVLVFHDNSKFQGYFQDDLICGVGCFYGLEYKFKGIWSQNRLQKVVFYYEYR